MAVSLSGIPLRDSIKAELASVVSHIPQEEIPQLSIIQVGDNEASNVYIRGKVRFGEDIGVKVLVHHFPEDTAQEEILKLISSLNADPKVGGIIIQLPLPGHLNKETLIESIDAQKDIDGFHSSSGIIPATTRGILSLFNHYHIDLKDKKVLVIGRSDLVGKPTAQAVAQAGAIVTVAHKETQDIPSLARAADIIISITGAAGLITKEYVKEGHIIIDVGITRKDGKIVGDVDAEQVFLIVSALSPVPGGVGPLTIASLFQNLLRKYT